MREKLTFKPRTSNSDFNQNLGPWLLKRYSTFYLEPVDNIVRRTVTMASIHSLLLKIVNARMQNRLNVKLMISLRWNIITKE